MVERKVEALGVVGSSPALSTIYAYLAQSGLEHPTLNRGVAGSNPPMGTIYPRSSMELEHPVSTRYVRGSSPFGDTICENQVG